MRSEVQTGSERASVAVLEGQLQPPGNTPRRRNCGTGKEARKIDHVHAIGQIRGLNLQGRTPLLLAVDFEPCSSVQRKVRFHSSSRQIHFVQYLGAKLSQQQTWVSTTRSEEHTSELQSRLHLVCRLLLEKKNYKQYHYSSNHIQLNYQ